MTRMRLSTPSRFSPGNCEPAVLEAILVGRHRLLDRLIASVRADVEGGGCRHHLLLGPRGIGKTHLVALLNHRLRTEPALEGKVVVAWMREEERGVGSVEELLLRVLAALSRHDAVEIDLGERIDRLYDLPLERLRDGALSLLDDALAGRRLVVLVENLGMLFSKKEGFGAPGQQGLRDILQDRSQWTILATAQAIPVDIQGEAGPLSGQFTRHPLQPLDAAQAWTLLDRMAALEDRADLREFIDTPAGRGRVRAIHELCGGNPRLLVVFFQFVDRNSLTALARHFLERTELLTSYYQERLNGRSTLEQKIVQVLCANRAPMGVQDISRACLSSAGSVSKQLSELHNAAIVARISRGRSTLYELREPLMRIAFEVKENLGFPVGLFVEFLARFYGRAELETRRLALWFVGQTIDLSDPVSARALAAERGYLEAALGHANQVGAPRVTLREVLVQLLHRGGGADVVRLVQVLQTAGHHDGWMAIVGARGHRAVGDEAAAEAVLRERVEADDRDEDALDELVEVVLDRGGRAEAEALVRGWEARSGRVPSLAVARLRLREGEPAKALAVLADHEPCLRSMLLQLDSVGSIAPGSEGHDHFEALLERLTSQWPDDPRVLLRRVIWQAVSGAPGDVVAELIDTIRTEALTGEELTRLAATAAHLELHGHALRLWRRVARRRPTWPRLWNRTLDSAEHVGDLGLARDILREWCAGSPESRDAAVAAQLYGQAPIDLDLLDAIAAEHKVTDVAALARRVALLVLAGRLEEALTLLAANEGSEPHLARACVLLALVDRGDLAGELFGRGAAQSEDRRVLLIEAGRRAIRGELRATEAEVLRLEPQPGDHPQLWVFWFEVVWELGLDDLKLRLLQTLLAMDNPPEAVSARLLSSPSASLLDESDLLLELSQRLARLHPDRARWPRFEAQLHDFRGAWEAAEEVWTNCMVGPVEGSEDERLEGVMALGGALAGRTLNSPRGTGSASRRVALLEAAVSAWATLDAEFLADACALALQAMLQVLSMEATETSTVRVLVDLIADRGWLPADHPSLRIALAALALVDGDDEPSLSLTREERKVLAAQLKRPVPGFPNP